MTSDDDAVTPSVEEGGTAAPKSILLFADGTGNSAAKLFKTNVWRVYQAVDTGPTTASGQRRQIAYYHGGVGTSAFKPLQLLGGIFGIGLKNNIIDMYCFVCRNYREGDHLYFFGFSRGAFTARVLASLILTRGIVQCETDELLRAHAADAYRAYRRRYKLPLLGGTKKDFEKDVPSEAKAAPTTDDYYLKAKVGLVDRIRDLRDGMLELWRQWAWTTEQRETRSPLEVKKVAFIGVWDTVAAYGLPLEELTRAIDDWVWPLSMPNTALADGVRCARHALALDEERDSFQPLLWDELWNRERVAKGVVPEDRLRQVWFAGVHSNVGGGYADDGLSHVPLLWMMDEAELAGVRYKPQTEWGWTPSPDPFGHLYDSRSGVAGYYRPQTRRIDAKIEQDPADPHLLLLQDPRVTPPGLLVEPILVHESVLERMSRGTDRYAPIALPARFDVVGRGPRRPLDLADSGQVHWPTQVEKVFDHYWLRRVIYFATVAASLLLAAFPVIEAVLPPSACAGPQCLASPLISAAGGLLPSLLAPWVEAFARSPGLFLVNVALIVALMAQGAGLKRRAFDTMRDLWTRALGLPAPAIPPVAAHAPLPARWIRPLRTSARYQGFMQTMKWQLIPSVFGILFLGLIGAAAVIAGYRGSVAVGESVDGWGVCGEPGAASPRFDTRDPCWPLAGGLQANRRYRITLSVVEPWNDGGTIPASPMGSTFIDVKDRVVMRVFAWTRRVLAAAWFQPILRTTAPGVPVHLTPLVFTPVDPGAAGGAAGERFSADFVAERSGDASLFVNDAPFAFAYANNCGTADVLLEAWNVQSHAFEPMAPRRSEAARVAPAAGDPRCRANAHASAP
ncbi:DUF2235 domain-containing protein [Methylobacterium sp. JK268]